MSVHKRGEKWVVRVQRNSRRIQRTLSTEQCSKREAEDLESELRTKLKDDSKWSEKIPWKTAVVEKYLSRFRPWFVLLYNGCLPRNLLGPFVSASDQQCHAG